MYQWSKTRRWWFEKAEPPRGVTPEVYVLDKVVWGLDRYFQFSNGQFSALQLLRDSQVLSDYCAKNYSIIEILPVDPEYIINYSSWLYLIDKKKKQCGILIATIDQRTKKRIVPTIAEKARGTCAAVLRFVAFVGHEVGHVALEHTLTKIADLKPSERFPTMSPEQEWEAWLFSRQLLGFIVADYSVETREKENRDGVSDLLFDE